MEHYDKVSWAKLDHNGSATRYSKNHLVDHGSKTLCGTDIPSHRDGYDIDGASSGNSDCKRCESVRKKLQGQ